MSSYDDPVEPLLELRDVLRTEFDATRIPYSVVPSIHTGWYGDRTTKPQISVGTANGPVETDQTVGVDSETGKTVIETSGTAFVNCWAGSRRDLKDDSDATTVHPKHLARLMRVETKRVFHTYADGIADGTGGYRLRSISPLGAIMRADTEDRDGDDVVVFRYEVEVGYTYRSRL